MRLSPPARPSFRALPGRMRRSLVVTLGLPVLVVAGCASASSAPATKSSVDYASRRTCAAAQLESRVASGGSEASQPFVIIEVIDNGPWCSIGGYPRILAATGHALQGPSQPLSISVR